MSEIFQCIQFSPSNDSIHRKMHQTLTFVVSDVWILSNPSSGAHTWADHIKVQTTFFIQNLLMNGLLKRYKSWVYLNFEGIMSPTRFLKEALGLRNSSQVDQKNKNALWTWNDFQWVDRRYSNSIECRKRDQIHSLLWAIWNLWIWSHSNMDDFLINQWDW